MSKASTRILEQGTTPSPAPDLIPLKPKSTEDSHCGWYSEWGHITPNNAQVRQETIEKRPKRNTAKPARRCVT